MNKSVAIGLALLVGTFQACSGSIEERTTKPKGGSDSYVQAYRMIPMIGTTETTTVVDKTTGTVSNQCTPQTTKVLISRPDYANPIWIVYHHGFLETSSFSVTLSSDGVLTAVSTQSTPPASAIASTVLPALITAAATVAVAAAIPANKALPPCTDGVVITSIEPCTPRNEFGCTAPPPLDPGSGVPSDGQ